MKVRFSICQAHSEFTFETVCVVTTECLKASAQRCTHKKYSNTHTHTRRTALRYARAFTFVLCIQTRVALPHTPRLCTQQNVRICMLFTPKIFAHTHRPESAMLFRFRRFISFICWVESISMPLNTYNLSFGDTHTAPFNVSHRHILFHKSTTAHMHWKPIRTRYIVRICQPLLSIIIIAS